MGWNQTLNLWVKTSVWLFASLNTLIYKLILLVSLLHPLPILTMSKNYMKLFQINIGLGMSNESVVVTTILYSSTVSSIVFQYIACIIFQQRSKDFFAAESLLEIHSVLTGRQDISRGWPKTRNKRKKFPTRRLRLSWNADFPLDGEEFLIM